MYYFKDRTGHRYGRLLVIERYMAPDSAARGWRTIWRCVCDCGTEKLVSGHDLGSGCTQSCGCYLKQRISETKRTHGHTWQNGKKNVTKTYYTWQAAKNRCFNSRCKDYYLYGARGITMCDTWRNSYSVFLADMGEKPEGTSLDRINGERGYEPGNCRWATAKQQGENTRKCRSYFWKGAHRNQSDIARMEGVSQQSISRALKRFNDDVEGALTHLRRAMRTPP